MTIQAVALHEPLRGGSLAGFPLRKQAGLQHRLRLKGGISPTFHVRSTRSQSSQSPSTCEPSRGSLPPGKAHSKVLRAHGRGGKEGARRAASPLVDAQPATAAFADEQDHLKAGGTERGFVVQQISKSTEGQQRLAEHLPPLSSSGQDTLDVAIVGCGPAGLALAAELGKRGVSVGIVGRDTPWVNTYGVWPDEFKAVGFGSCLGQTWNDTILYAHSDVPISTGRPYAKVDRSVFRAELVQRCKAARVQFLDREVKSIEDVEERGSTVVSSEGERVKARLVVVAAGAASGKFLNYGRETRGVGVQTAYGIEVELDTPYPYDPNAMLFMDYRDLPPPTNTNSQHHRAEEGSFAALPSFLYAMPSPEPTHAFFEETCLAARPAMPFSVLKERLERRLQGLGVKYKKIIEEEWSYIPVGGALPDTTQQHLGFGAAACLIHPATGYSVTRSMAEAPLFALAIATALQDKSMPSRAAAQQAWPALWSEERKRQRAFMIFGLELILQLDTNSTRDFFTSFFKLPEWLWRGFLASSLSSVDLLLFAFHTFLVAPNSLRVRLIRHLLLDPSGADLIRSYLRI